MVWAGFSYYGRTSLILIDKGVKFNADNYINKINKILKPFLTKDVPSIFPGRENEMVFHQDSASSPTAKTIDFVNKRTLITYTVTGLKKTLKDERIHLVKRALTRR